jgi:DNA-binding transcriptional LysR family regulator
MPACAVHEKRFVAIAAITGNDGCVDAWNLPDLIVFLEVVRAGSLTRAAVRLHTVQSNVTARMKSLEHALGVPLLARHARGVRPTPAGEAALVFARRADALLDDLRFTFGHPARTAAKLRLGAIETVAATHLPVVVAGFGRQHPQVDVSVQTASSAALLGLLKDGALDVVFVSRPAKAAGLREQVAFRDELVVVAPPALGPLPTLLAAAGPPIKVLVQRLGCSYTDRLLTHIGQTSTRTYRLHEVGTLEGILGFVEAGVGIAAMPRAFASSLARGRKIRLGALPRALSRLETYVVAPVEASRVTDEFFARFAKQTLGPKG